MLPNKQLTEELRELSGWTEPLTLGYLLRKLHPVLDVLRPDTVQYRWVAEYTDEDGIGSYFADTPEDALCMLTINLFERGILPLTNLVEE